jgi:hypothetical protein
MVVLLFAFLSLSSALPAPPLDDDSNANDSTLMGELASHAPQPPTCERDKRFLGTLLAYLAYDRQEGADEAMEPTPFRKASTHASNTLPDSSSRDDDAEPASFREVFPLTAKVSYPHDDHAKPVSFKDVFSLTESESLLSKTDEYSPYYLRFGADETIEQETLKRKPRNHEKVITNAPNIKQAVDALDESKRRAIFLPPSSHEEKVKGRHFSRHPLFPYDTVGDSKLRTPTSKRKPRGPVKVIKLESNK